MNAGVEPHDKRVSLPTVRAIARAAAVANTASSPLSLLPQLAATASASPPGSATPPDDQCALVGFYALDLASAYRYLPLQLLDLWCHFFPYLDEEAHVGIATDTRLCFGGSYGPNRSERVSTLLSAFVLACQAEFDSLNPFPPAVQRWREHRAALQRVGRLPPGEAQLCPRSLLAYLDDFSGSGGTDTVCPPVGYAPITFDAAAMVALGLRPARLDSRVAAYATIAAGKLERAGFSVAAAKSMVGSSVIALGLQPDVDRYAVLCPLSKRRLLLAQLEETENIVLESRDLERKPE